MDSRFVKILDWVDVDRLDPMCIYANTNPLALAWVLNRNTKIDWMDFAYNPSAVPFIEYMDIDSIRCISGICYNKGISQTLIDKLWNSGCILDGGNLSMNTSRVAVSFLERHRELINFGALSSNASAWHITKQNLADISMFQIAANEHSEALKFLESHTEYIIWEILAENANPLAFKIMEQHIDNVDWYVVSKNESDAAIDFLKKYYYYIDWNSLSQNKNAESLLKDNPHLINWRYASSNPALIDLLEQNKDIIDYDRLAKNPAIFTYDYELIKKTNAKKNQCIIEWFYRPCFIEKFIEEHGMDAIDQYKISYNP